VAQGSNLLAGTRPPAILAAARRALSGELPTDRRPPLWDGQAARRIVDHLARLLPA
jgi:UDP-N-acetylglucosamine 2-epimerase (non-hydrolysing)